MQWRNYSLKRALMFISKRFGSILGIEYLSKGLSWIGLHCFQIFQSFLIIELSSDQIFFFLNLLSSKRAMMLVMKLMI